MRLLEIIKRIAPFALALALGLFIASFFVSITPNFNFKRGGKHRQNHYLKNENERLQKRIEYLERRNAKLESEKFEMNSEFENSFTIPAPPMPPPPPMAPKAVR